MTKEKVNLATTKVDPSEFMKGVSLLAKKYEDQPEPIYGIFAEGYLINDIKTSYEFGESSTSILDIKGFGYPASLDGVLVFKVPSEERFIKGRSWFTVTKSEYDKYMALINEIKFIRGLTTKED